MNKVYTLLFFLFCPALLWAETLHPLAGLDAQLLPQNRWELRLGTKYTENRWFPFEERNTHRKEWDIPFLNLDIGVANNVELNFSYPYIYLDSDHTHHSWDSGDLCVGVKIRLWHSEDKTTFLTLNMKTKLPNGDYSNRFSTNEADFFAEGLFSKKWRNLKLFINGGLGIIGNPKSCNSQDDVLSFAVGIRYKFNELLKGLVEINGWTFSAYENNYTVLTFGGQYLFSSHWRLDTGLHIGLTDESEDWGISGGITYIFDWGR